METPPPPAKKIFSALGKTLVVIFILPILMPGFLLAWSMAVQALLERAGYAVPTYSRYAICFTLDEFTPDDLIDDSAVQATGSHIPVEDCQHLDRITDDGDGPDDGRIRWQACWGIDCGETLEYGGRELSADDAWDGARIAVLIFAVLFLAVVVLLPIGISVQVLRAIFSVDVRRRIRSRKFTYFLGLVLAVVIVAPVSWVERIKIPSDDELQSDYIDKAAVFAELAAMLREDGTLRYISQTMVSPSTEEMYRTAEPYYGLMEEAGLLCLNSDWEETQTITFRRHDTYPNASFAKGYVYAAQEPAPIMMTLDRGYGDLPAQTRAYRHIMDNWYLYIENQTFP